MIPRCTVLLVVAAAMIPQGTGGFQGATAPSSGPKLPPVQTRKKTPKCKSQIIRRGPRLVSATITCLLNRRTREGRSPSEVSAPVPTRPAAG